MSMRQGFNFVPKILNVNRKPGQPKKKRKVTLVFDEDKRKEYLCGFRKRKLERKLKAKQEIEAQWKEEKKRIKKEAQEKFKKLVSQRDVPELEELLSQHEYETDGKSVSILELNINQLTQSANWIGENKPTYEEVSENDEESDEEEEDVVPGMELKRKKSKIVDDEDESKVNLSKKERSRAIQKETLQSRMKNQVFLRKQKMLRMKNKKLAIREKMRKGQSVKDTKGKKRSKKLSRGRTSE
ncbi:uncharacterized protein LOC130665390 [Microplitis mediator]|uniref:uncharacterized protein LOC130665390 n=1 Tax=Microplitis mediator TaxID=375433 RepID=UPI0025523040|nr:uncharacterized protein LOC130665390 [Microplitis mediator]